MNSVLVVPYMGPALVTSYVLSVSDVIWIHMDVLYLRYDFERLLTFFLAVSILLVFYILGCRREPKLLLGTSRIKAGVSWCKYLVLKLDMQ